MRKAKLATQVGLWDRSLRGRNTSWLKSGQVERWVGWKNRDSVMADGYSSLIFRRSEVGSRGGEGHKCKPGSVPDSLQSCPTCNSADRPGLPLNFIFHILTSSCVQWKLCSSLLSRALRTVKCPELHSTLAHPLQGLHLSPPSESWISSSEPSLALTPWKQDKHYFISGNFPMAWVIIDTH